MPKRDIIHRGNSLWGTGKNSGSGKCLTILVNFIVDKDQTDFCYFDPIGKVLFVSGDISS